MNSSGSARARSWHSGPVAEDEELVDAARLVRRSGPLIVLGHLGTGQTARRAKAHQGAPADPKLVSYVQGLTAGHPILVDLVLDVLSEEAPDDDVPTDMSRSMVHRTQDSSGRQ